MRRPYNRVYHWHRLVLQVLLEVRKGFTVQLLPTIIVTVCGEFLHFGFSLEWLWGDISFGVMNAAFAGSERKRIQDTRERAAKQGLTQRQYEMRWGS